MATTRAPKAKRDFYLITYRDWHPSRASSSGRLASRRAYGAAAHNNHIFNSANNV
jgi:hypothetical protein